MDEVMLLKMDNNYFLTILLFDNVQILVIKNNSKRNSFCLIYKLTS